MLPPPSLSAGVVAVEPSSQLFAGAAGQSGPRAGRRAGLPLGCIVASSELGAFFAHAAYLKAASVEAFSGLHEELFRLKAPDDLVLACLSSATDEVRHAIQVSSLAERFGGSVHGLVACHTRRRSLLELAVENAVDGCVLETYGALEASFQAEHALDEEVREIMEGISRDETVHAALSWRLHAWFEDQLSVEDWCFVEDSMREAIEGLRGELRMPRGVRLVSVAGLPDEDTAQALLDGLCSSLWPLDRLVA